MRDLTCDKCTLDWTSCVTWPLQHNSTDTHLIMASSCRPLQWTTLLNNILGLGQDARNPPPEFLVVSRREERCPQPLETGNPSA